MSNDILMQLVSLVWPLHLATGVFMAKALDLANDRGDCLLTYIITIIAWPIIGPVRFYSFFSNIRNQKKSND